MGGYTCNGAEKQLAELEAKLKNSREALNEEARLVSVPTHWRFGSVPPSDRADVDRLLRELREKLQ